MRPRVATLVVLLLSTVLAGCAAPALAPTAPREATAAEDACLDASLAFEPATLRVGERGVLRWRVENCGAEPVWYHADGCGAGPLVKGPGPADVWHLQPRQAVAARLAMCPAVMPGPEDLRAFEPGAVLEQEWRWNGSVEGWDHEDAAGPAGEYEIAYRFATVERRVRILLAAGEGDAA